MQQDSSLTDRGGGGKVAENTHQGQGYRGGSKISRKVSDAAIYGFNRPREMEEMKPEKEPLKIGWKHPSRYINANYLRT